MSFVDAAQAFKCSVKVQKGDFEVDGKSIMEVMMLAATKGTKLDVICEGDDADHCAKAALEAGGGGVWGGLSVRSAIARLARPSYS